MKKDKNISIEKEQGFMLVVLILGLLILSLLYIFSVSRIQTQSQKDNKEMIDASLQNPQQTVNNIRNQINDQIQNEQQKLNDATKELD